MKQTRNERQEKLKKDILNYIKKKKHPVTTRNVALYVRRAWHTVLTALLRLQNEGKVNSYRAGNMWVWYL